VGDKETLTEAIIKKVYSISKERLMKASGQRIPPSKTQVHES